MRIMTMRLPEVLKKIDNETLVFTRSVRDGQVSLLNAVEKGWPIGLITVTELDGTYVVQDGSKRLAALHQALTRPGVTRLKTGRYVPGQHEGIPAHVLTKTLDFLKWLNDGNEELSEEAHKAATRLAGYEIPFAVVEHEQGLRAWLTT